MDIDEVHTLGLGMPAWFKFLLDEDLLEKQIKSNPGGVSHTAILISTFLHQADVSFGILRDIRVSENLFGDDEVTDISENNRIICLKLLASKAASSTSWDLDYMHKCLPANHIHTLLMFLVKLITTNESIQLLNPDLNVESISPVALFVLNLFCCWSLKFIVEESLPLKPSKVPHVQIPGLYDPCMNFAANKETIFKMLQDREGDCIVLLEKILTSQHLVADMPTMKCFSLNNEVTDFCDWSHCKRISSSEIFSQASYSLGCLFFLRKRYHSALLAFECCQRSVTEVKDSSFMKVFPLKVEGYLRACKGVMKAPLNIALSLHEQITKSFNSNYQEMISVLTKDLDKQELSLSFRFELEDRAIADQLSKRNVHTEVLSCNALRRIMDGRLVAHNFVKNALINNNLISFLAKICNGIYLKVPDYQQIHIKEFLIYLSLVLPVSMGTREALLKESLEKHFNDNELRLLSPSSYVPPLMNKCDLSFLESSANEAIKVVNNEQKLLTCYEAAKVNEILFGLVGVVAKYNLLFLSDKWHLPLELHNTLESISLSHVHLSTLFNTLMAKSRICQQLELYKQGRELLEYVDLKLRETTYYKLIKLLKWEILSLDLSSIFNAKNSTCRENMELVERAKNCLTSVHLEPDLQPSSESLRLSILQLLNNEEWEFLISISSSNEIVQFGHMIGGLCKELNQLKTARVLARNFIEFIALTFSTPSKKPLKGVVTKDCFLNFVSLISNETVLSVFISCLTKLLRFIDQTMSGDIFSDYVTCWPSSITNTMLDKDAILEAVHCVLNRAISVNNKNVSWIRTQADLFFAMKQYHVSLKYYIYLGMIGSDYFSQPITRSIYDDQVCRRMIQACTHLNCSTQAIVMCQFLDELDYSTAFKCITERPILDGGDFYYSYIWDTTMLEFIINSHQRHAEIEKLCYAHQLMRAHEMNSNRKPEACQEILRNKKSKFLRRMADQYLGMIS